MADIPADGNIRVAFLLSCANIAAPTVAELNAGIQLAYVATADGLTGWEPETASIPNRKLGSTYDSVDVGSVSMSEPSMTFFKQDGTDTTYNTMSYRAAGFIVIRRSIDTDTAWTAAQKLMGTFPVKCGQRKWLNVEANTMERWTMPFKVHVEPYYDSVVA